MLGNTDFLVFIPNETYDHIKAICKQRNWTHGMLLGALVDKCPPIEMRTAFPPLDIKRSESPRCFKAHIDGCVKRRIAYICELRNWSHRDMVVHLLNHYMEVTHG